MAIDSAKLLPPPPYKTPFLNAQGFLNEPWNKWIRQLFQRVGGADALSNLELQEGYVTQDEIDDLNDDLTAVSTALSLEIDGLNQGRTP